MWQKRQCGHALPVHPAVSWLPPSEPLIRPRRIAWLLVSGCILTVASAGVGFATELGLLAFGQSLGDRRTSRGQLDATGWRVIRVGAMSRVVLFLVPSELTGQSSSFLLPMLFGWSDDVKRELWGPGTPVPDDLDRNALFARWELLYRSTREPWITHRDPLVDSGLPLWVESHLGGEPESRLLGQLQVTDGLGWPMAAFTGSMVFAPFTRQSPYFALETHGCFLLDDRNDWSFALPSSAPRPADIRMLPYQPVWLGLAVDVAFWSIVSALVAMAARWIRDRLRDRALRCRGCGYSLAGQQGDVCPECGAGIRPKAARLRAR